jgi:hypothetical protein
MGEGFPIKEITNGEAGKTVNGSGVVFPLILQE